MDRLIQPPSWMLVAAGPRQGIWFTWGPGGLVAASCVQPCPCRSGLTDHAVLSVLIKPDVRVGSDHKILLGQIFCIIKLDQVGSLYFKLMN